MNDEGLFVKNKNKYQQSQKRLSYTFSSMLFYYKDVDDIDVFTDQVDKRIDKSENGLFEINPKKDFIVVRIFD